MEYRPQQTHRPRRELTAWDTTPTAEKVRILEEKKTRKQDELNTNSAAAKLDREISSRQKTDEQRRREALDQLNKLFEKLN